MRLERVHLLPLILVVSPALEQTEEDHVLLAGDNEVQDFFGRRLAVSEEWALVAEPNDQVPGHPWSGSTGTVFFYRREVEGWRLAQQVSASDWRLGENFGRAVALDGGVAVVGDPYHDFPLNKRGAAYVFEFRDGVWVETARLAPDGVDLGDRFGWSVDVDGERVLVCATTDDDVHNDNGAGYVFERVDGTWTKAAKLLPRYDFDDPVSGLGYSCALSGDVAVLTEGTAVVLFERLAGHWQETQVLLNPLPFPSGFGDSVDLEGDTLVVGAPTDVYVNEPGSIAVYVRDSPGQWSLHTIRNAPKPDIDGGIGTDRFGESVAIEGKHILVGAPMAPNLAGEYVGQAYLFRLKPNKVKFLERFAYSAAEEGINHLGNAVALSKSAVLVADEVAYGPTPGVRSGAVFAYDRALGKSYCPGQPNSKGLAGTLEVTGSIAAEVGVVELSATNLPRHELAFFLASRIEGFVQNPAGSDGNLCLGDPIARLTTSLGSTGEAGALEHTLESMTIPLEPPDTIEPGESWSFQAWYRDRASAGGSNFTDAVTVVFD